MHDDINPIAFVIPGLTRDPVPLGAVFLDSRFRGNDDFRRGLYRCV